MYVNIIYWGMLNKSHDRFNSRTVFFYIGKKVFHMVTRVPRIGILRQNLMKLIVVHVCVTCIRLHDCVFTTSTEETRFFIFFLNINKKRMPSSIMFI